MSTHNIYFYREVDKKYTGCNLKITELLDCAFIGVCAIIRSNMVCANTIFNLNSGTSQVFSILDL